MGITAGLGKGRGVCETAGVVGTHGGHCRCGSHQYVLHVRESVEQPFAVGDVGGHVLCVHHRPCNLRVHVCHAWCLALMPIHGQTCSMPSACECSRRGCGADDMPS